MNLFKKIFFNFLYLTRPPWDTGITPPELVSFIDSSSPGRALDLGCGTGTNAIYMAQHGWRVSGVDFISRAIHAARQKAEKAGVEVDFYVDSVTRLKGINGTFDLILDIGCLHNLQEKERSVYIQNLKRLLNKQGTFLIYTFIQDESHQKSGVSEADIAIMRNFMRLESRQDGMERGIRASAWLRFTR
jgi:cyclopropane fatty-acyl-phospholipid synthase-like methyltransferase